MLYNLLARKYNGCPLRSKCLGKTPVKKIETSYYQDEMDHAWKRQHSLDGKRMVRERGGTVEPVFGSLINYYGLRKINVKGKSGAHKCMLMAAIAFNIKKLMKFLNRKRQSAVVELQGQLCANIKTAFSGFFSSNWGSLVISYK